MGPKCTRCPSGNETTCPTGCARPGYRAAGPGPRRPWSLPQERNSPGRYHLNGAYPKEPSIRPQAAVLGSGVWVRMGAIAVFRPPGGEAQTAAGPRGRRYLPKTACRCNWRAHFGFTGLKACPFAACLSFCERCLRFFCGGKVPPADFDSLRGDVGAFFCCSVTPFRCGGRVGGLGGLS